MIKLVKWQLIECGVVMKTVYLPKGTKPHGWVKVGIVKTGEK